jgi:hypothetical protein
MEIIQKSELPDYLQKSGIVTDAFLDYDQVMIPKQFIFDDSNTSGYIVPNDNTFYLILKKLRYWMVKTIPSFMCEYICKNLTEFRPEIYEEIFLLKFHKNELAYTSIIDSMIPKINLIGIEMVKEFHKRNVLNEFDSPKHLKSTIEHIYKYDLHDCLQYLCENDNDIANYVKDKLKFFRCDSIKCFTYMYENQNLGKTMTRMRFYNENLCSRACGLSSCSKTPCLKILKYLHEVQKVPLHINLVIDSHKYYKHEHESILRTDRKKKYFEVTKYIIENITIRESKHKSSFVKTFYETITNYCLHLDSIELLELALFKGFLLRQDGLCYIMSGGMYTNSAVEQCLENDNLDILKYIIDDKLVDHEKTLKTLVIRGKFDIFKWMIDRFNIDKNIDFTSSVVGLHRQFIDLKVMVVSDIYYYNKYDDIENEKLKCLKYLIEKGFVITHKILNNYTFPKIFKFAFNYFVKNINYMPSKKDRDLIMLNLKNNLIFILNIPKKVPQYSNSAVKRNHKEIITFLQENNDILSTLVT